MTEPRVRLDELLAQTRAPWVEHLRSSLADSPEITSITQDSRTVTPGALFCALSGSNSDGHDHVGSAIEAGAAAVLVERHVTDAVPELLVTDARTAMGELAAAFNGHPDVQLVAVTGTNGKTSIVTLLAHIVNSCGGSAASMGTLTGSLTTLAAPEFHASLREHHEAGRNIVAAEVSSHALDQGRISGSIPAVSIFTNLSQDHLDYHESMESYFEAKARLFDEPFVAPAVIDVSDSWGARLVERLADSTPRTIVAVDGAGYVSGATLHHTSSEYTWRDHEVLLCLGGAFSVINAVLASEAAVILGYDVAGIVEALGTVPQIPGRFESIDQGQPFGVFVDYSHTPGSIDAAVESARTLTNGAVRIVFGAAGDRDPGKRPLMGRAASAADVLFVTSDNPRSEDPEVIIDQVVAGIESTPASDVHRISDRAEAIGAAISGAAPGDIVLITGKGHEDYQIIGSTRTDFDDRVEARAALAFSGWEGAA